MAALPLQTRRVYTLGIVLSNPSASQASVEVVAPCPEGAVPVGGRNFVDVRNETCSPFSCMRAEIQFYFPDAGRFESPAVSITRKGRPLQTLRLPDMAELEVRPCMRATVHACYQVDSTKFKFQIFKLQGEPCFHGNNLGTHSAKLYSFYLRGKNNHYIAFPLVQVVGKAGSRNSAQALTPGTRAWLLSREASDRDVLHAVTHATHALPVEQLAWRCRNSEQFFKELLEALRAAGITHPHLRYCFSIYRYLAPHCSL